MELCLTASLGFLLSLAIIVWRIRNERRRAAIISDYVDLLMAGKRQEADSLRAKHAENGKLIQEMDTALMLYLSFLEGQKS